MPRRRNRGADGLPEFRNAQTTPTWFFDVAHQLAMGRPEIVLQMPTKNVAVNMRQRFHIWRKRAVVEQLPDAEAAINCQVSIENDCLKFTNLAPMWKAIEKQLRPDRAMTSENNNLPETLPPGHTFNFEPGDGSIAVNPPPKKVDKAEEFIANYYGITAKKEQQRVCVHEEDASGNFCLKCSLPKFKWEEAK